MDVEVGPADLPAGAAQVPLTRLECRVALFRAEHGIMLDQPIALAAALRTLLSDWDHSLPAEPRAPMS